MRSAELCSLFSKLGESRLSSLSQENGVSTAFFIGDSSGPRGTLGEKEDLARVGVRKVKTCYCYGFSINREKNDSSRFLNLVLHLNPENNLIDNKN